AQAGERLGVHSQAHCRRHRGIVEACSTAILHTQSQGATGGTGHGEDDGGAIGRVYFSAPYVGDGHGPATDRKLRDGAGEMARTLDGTADILLVDPGVENTNMQQITHGPRADGRLRLGRKIFWTHGTQHPYALARHFLKAPQYLGARPGAVPVHPDLVTLAEIVFHMPRVRRRVLRGGEPE